MEKYCKNCGAALDKSTQVCPDCGREVENPKKYVHSYCPSCGGRIDDDENFCRNCGVQIKNNEVAKESFLEKYEIPLTITAVVLIIVMFTVIAFFSFDASAGQSVEVDTIVFNIPENFTLDESSEIEENDAGIHTSSKTWKRSDDHIRIDVMYSTEYDVDENKVLNNIDGKKENMMGYDGKYAQTGKGYEFSFVKDNKLCTIYTTNSEIFDEILIE